MAQPTPALKPKRGVAGIVDPTVEAERKARKRIQNKLNQRARRLRNNKDKNAVYGNTRRLPYRVHRWRINFNEPQSSYISDAEPADSPESEYSVALRVSSQSREVRLSLPADHLLHLIYYNVFRGLYSNKELLLRCAVSMFPGSQKTVPFHDDSVFPGYSVVLPVAPDLPECLTPTQTQMSRVHFTWIDLLPFPKMRENLIKMGAYFDHFEFVKDLVGNLVDERHYYSPRSSPRPKIIGRSTMAKRYDDEVTTTRKGLIIWGEPYMQDSWEATPGFLQKWAWAVDGCEELTASTNRWRMVRGEEPIQFSP